MLRSQTPHDAKEELALAALDALREVTGLTSRLVPLSHNVGRNRQFDVAVEVATEYNSFLFYGECIARIDRQSIVAHAKNQLDELDAPGLLIAPYLTGAMIDACRTVGLRAIDTAGNAYLDARGLYVFVKGQKATMARVAATPKRRGGSASALRIIFALLVAPSLARAPYREIAAAAGVALGSVGAIFDDLAQRGLVTNRDRTHGRRILEPQRLLDEWGATYPIRLRPKLHARRFQVPNPDWWQTVDPVELDAWWSGDVAADRLTGQLKPAAQTLYIAPDQARRSINELVARHRLRPDPNGAVEILDAFWVLPRNSDYPDIAPPLLVYTDLVASLDPRNLAIAKPIREMALADAHYSL